jgi:hypothetical protein
MCRLIGSVGGLRSGHPPDMPETIDEPLSLDAVDDTDRTIERLDTVDHTDPDTDVVLRMLKAWRDEARTGLDELP